LTILQLALSFEGLITYSAKKYSSIEYNCVPPNYMISLSYFFPVKNKTILCRHGYHLQCIMQWAQRSRECPLCFHTLQLDDEVMNSLLPFGEYINPQQTAATAALLENWEMERFLVSLAVAEQRERRAARSSRRRSHPQGVEPSAPRPIIGSSARGRTEPQEISSISSGGGGGGGASSLPGRDQNNALGGEYPSSWPPSRQDVSGEGPSSQVEGLSQAIKSRWASLKFRLVLFFLFLKVY
jgi:RING-H2 zinc finger domain